MAIPRVFISSTYFDLKHMRSSLEKFIESLGFEAILSEKGSIAYAPDRPLDESCYKEAEGADILVLMVGGRYGSPTSSGTKKLEKTFFERYDSITKKEFEAAAAGNVPIFIAVDRAVHVEYETFLKNRDSDAINYAHVQNVNVFVLLESILNMPKNNPVFAFDRPAEVEDWLRLQWAGLFGEMLRERTEHSQLASLAAQVANLAEVNRTLKVYLEEVVSKVSGNAAAALISSEDSRLRAARRQAAFRRNRFVEYCRYRLGLEADVVAELLRQQTDVKAFLGALVEKTPEHTHTPSLRSWQAEIPRRVHSDIELARATLGLPFDARVANSGREPVDGDPRIEVERIPSEQHERQPKRPPKPPRRAIKKSTEHKP